jgi:hypothetical protein
VLRVVLPIIPTRTRWLIGWAVSTVYVGVAVGVPVEIIIVVNCDVVVPTPTAAIAPTSAPCCAHRQSHTERNRHTSGIVADRRIGDGRIGVDRRAIHDHWIVARYVDDLRIRLFDDHDLLGFHHLDFHLLLFGGFQVACVLCLFPHALNSIHNGALLSEKCVAKIGGPLNVIRETFDYFRKGSQPLNARVPRLFGDRICERFVLQAFVLRQPLLELDEFEWVCGRRENLRKHRVWIERDRSNQ